jgi:hypothetical protein
LFLADHHCQSMHITNVLSSIFRFRIS